MVVIVMIVVVIMVVDCHLRGVSVFRRGTHTKVKNSYETDARGDSDKMGSTQERSLFLAGTG